ncbi:hypothetical protein DRQ27_01220 [bacterium]|nr:MAG: hypothetical protein DRQ27_01220 [bacterium]
MFRKFLELWRKEDLLHQALRDTQNMMELTKEIYHYAIEPLFTGASIDGQQVYDMDKQINKFEIEIRRKVLEHLSVSPRQDITAALVLTTITVDLERIGDYAKNFFELYGLYGKPLGEGDISAKLRELKTAVSTMFDDMITSFSNADIELAKRVMEQHKRNSDECESIIAWLIKNPQAYKELGISGSVLSALAARYFKRTSAHIKNVASSVVNPFDRIGYKSPNSVND